MKRESIAVEFLTPPAHQVELALARIEASLAFRTSKRHRALLRHVVDRLLAGDLASLKETMIAIEVFGRPSATFDPRSDTIVRVEARRLRARLARYYVDEGRKAALRFELPVGSYVPLIAQRRTSLLESIDVRAARELAERGDHFLREALSRATLDKALARFDEAVRIAPRYAPAYVGLARAWFNLGTGWHEPPAVAFEHAAEALRSALALDPHQAQAHVLLGALQHQLERNWLAAERSFRRALSLAPDNAFVHSAYGAHLYMHGDLEAADRELTIARTIDPLYMNARTHLVNLRVAQGRIADAEAAVAAMRDIAPHSIAASSLTAVLALARGDRAAAKNLYEGLCAAHPDHPGCFIALAGALAADGDLDRSDELVNETLTRFGDRFVSPYVLAVVAAHGCRLDLAFSLLERAIDERDPSAVEIPFDISFVPLRTDLRWSPLVTRLNSVKLKRVSAIRHADRAGE